MNKKVLALGVSFAAALLMSCNNDPAPSVFDPNAPKNPAPVIRALVPADSALTNVGEIIINGENFAAEKDKNLVLFDNNQTVVLAASPTQLKIKTPDIISDSIKVLVAGVGSELFSRPARYKLKPAVQAFGRLEDAGRDVVKAFGLDVDRDGNVYVSTESNRIKKVAPDGKTSVITATATFLRANAIKVGPGNLLYMTNVVARLRRLSTIAPDGTESVFVSLPDIPQDFDFDQTGNIWVAVAAEVYLVRPNKTLEKIDTYPVTLAALRVYNGNLYVAGRNATTNEEKIWRSAIQGETLGAKEVVLDVAATDWLKGGSVLALTLSEAGEMYLGTSHPSGIFVVRPDKSYEVLYAGLIAPAISSLSWSDGKFLYALQQLATTTKLLKIDAAKKGAPYYGRR